MKKRMLLLTILLLTLIIHSAQAKGQASRIVITGDNIDGELIIDDPDLIPLLSMTVLEDFNFGQIQAMDTLTDGYTLSRQYETENGDFLPFDEVVYYPDPNGGRGYVHYLGIVNGLSEYDNRWYNVGLDAESALHRMFNDSQVRPYVLAYQNIGNLHIFDSGTLENLATLQITEDNTAISDLTTSANGQYISYTIDDEYFVVDLADGSNCRVDEAPAWVVSTPTLPSPYDLLDTDDEDLEITLTPQSTVIGYDSLYVFVHDPAQTGIKIVSRVSGAITNEWLPDVMMSQYVRGLFTLYGVDVQTDSATLYALDQYNNNNEILSEASLEADTWFIDYRPLDLSLLADDITLNCTD